MYFLHQFLYNKERIDIIMSTQGKIRVYARQGKNGISYTYCIEAGRDANGKRQRKTKSGFKTKAQAQKAGLKMLNELLLGNNIIESTITFEQYADEWLKKKGNVKPNTLAVIKSAISTAVNYFGNCKLKDITLYQYECFLNDYAQTHSKNSLNITDIYIKQIFASAKKYGVICKNPTDDAIKPKFAASYEKNITDKYLSTDELMSFLNVAKQKSQRKHQYFYYYCRLLAYTGLRIGEASALIWDNVSFEDKTLTIEATLFYGKKPYTRQLSPKTDTSRRTIRLDDNTLKLLKEWKNLQLQLRMKYGTRGTDDNINYVFTSININNRFEMPISNNRVAYLIKSTGIKAGIKKNIHPHIFRHTHASLLAEAGTQLEVISQRLGHSSSNITRKIYLHITQNLEQKSIEKFSDYMQKVSTF